MHGKFFVALVSLALLAQDEVVFRSTSKFIAVDAQVTAGGAAIGELRREDFRVFDNGRPQTIASFGADDQGLDVLLMIDVSQSTGAIQESLKAAASEAMAQLLPRDRLGIVVFADEPYVAAAPTENRAETLAALNRLPPGRGGTELHASVWLAARYLRERARPEARRAIVMLSDNLGYDGATVPEVLAELWGSNTVFNLLQFPGKGGRGKADVRPFAMATGGEVVPQRSPGVPLADLFRRLRKRYYFLYAAPEAKPGERRQIRVTLSDEARKRFPKAQVRARTGYISEPGLLP